MKDESCSFNLSDLIIKEERDLKFCCTLGIWCIGLEFIVVK